MKRIFSENLPSAQKKVKMDSSEEKEEKQEKHCGEVEIMDIVDYPFYYDDSELERGSSVTDSSIDYPDGYETDEDEEDFDYERGNFETEDEEYDEHEGEDGEDGVVQEFFEQEQDQYSKKIMIPYGWNDVLWTFYPKKEEDRTGETGETGETGLIGRTGRTGLIGETDKSHSSFLCCSICLENITLTSYESESEGSSSSLTLPSTSSSLSCSSSISLTSCKHTFHKSCFSSLLERRIGCCPNCRTSFLKTIK